MKETILVVDDETSILNVICSYLEHAGYRCIRAQDGRTALDLFTAKRPDAVVLDLMLPDITGEEVCRTIRRSSAAPVLMLTAKSGEENLLKGFSLGADDYLTKPFSGREMVARVGALIKRVPSRARTKENAESADGRLSLDTSTHVCLLGGSELTLTPTEFKILASMMMHPGKVFSREALLRIVAPDDFETELRTIDAHIKNLRRKVETPAVRGTYIQTVPGFGYRFGTGHRE